MKGLQDQVYCLVFPLNLLVKYLKYFIKFYTHKSLKICGPARSDCIEYRLRIAINMIDLLNEIETI